MATTRGKGAKFPTREFGRPPVWRRDSLQHQKQEASLRPSKNEIFEIYEKVMFD